ncbi:MAG: TolC family protein [Desulfuromonadia bacterium]
MKPLLSCVTALAFFLLATVGGARGEDHLPTLVELLRGGNPELSLLDARVRMAEARIPQVTSLEDPMLMLKLQNLLLREPWSLGGKDPQTATVIGISQTLPFPGKRGARGDVARFDAETQRYLVEEKRLELVRMLKESYYRVWFVDRTKEVVDRTIVTLGNLSSIAETRYTLGTAPQQDILQSGIETTRMHEMKTFLDRDRSVAVAAINAILGRPFDTPVIPPRDLPLPPLTATVADLVKSGMESRPRVKSLQSLLAKGDASGRLARLESWPDFTLSLEYMRREPAMGDPGYDMLTAGVTVNLPVWSARREGMVVESAQQRRMAKEEMDALRLSIEAEAAAGVARIDQRRKQLLLFDESIIPQAEQSLESALIGYQSGKLDFTALLAAEMALFGYERERLESRMEYLMELARLEALIGKDPVEVPGRGGKE